MAVKNETFDTRACFYHELESRISEENILTKSWKKTARFIKVFPVEIVPCFEEIARVIYYYITAEFRYAKRDSAYGCYVW